MVLPSVSPGTALLIRGSNRELLFYFQMRKKCPMTTVKKMLLVVFLSNKSIFELLKNT